MDYRDTVALYGNIPVLAALDPSSRKLLAFSSSLLRFAAGQLLFEEGTSSDAVYVITRGEVEVLIGPPGAWARVGRLGARELVGEMGVIMSVPRTASIRACQAVEALRIEGDIFLRLVLGNPAASLSVMRALSDKLHRTTQSYKALQARLQAVEPEGDIDWVG